MKTLDAVPLRRALLRWYDAAHRKMPWRPLPGRLGNPYHVMVSELMLQQTQVATVIPYFERFISQWPTIESLAAADEQQVLHLWQGLGYYRRARHLHQAAQKVVRDFNGTIPDDIDMLLQLPGVGRYTAGAIASIAFGRPAPILDGNVARVLARWQAMEEPVDAPAGQTQLWRWAEQMVARSRRPGDVNQAMMELGATVCLPTGPLCLHCPVQTMCEALKRGMVERLPVKAGKTVQKPVRHDVIAVAHGDRYLFVQRPRKGLWAEMWEWPTWEGEGDEGTEGRRDEVKTWAENKSCMMLEKLEKCGSFTHITTHRRITFVVWRASVASAPVGGCWRTMGDIADLPMSNAQKRAMTLVTSPVARSPRPKRR